MTFKLQAAQRLEKKTHTPGTKHFQYTSIIAFFTTLNNAFLVQLMFFPGNKICHCDITNVFKCVMLNHFILRTLKAVMLSFVTISEYQEPKDVYDTATH